MAKRGRRSQEDNARQHSDAETSSLRKQRRKEVVRRHYEKQLGFRLEPQPLWLIFDNSSAVEIRDKRRTQMAEKRAAIKAKRRRSDIARAAQAELERAELAASIALSRMHRKQTKARLRELKSSRRARRGESPLPPSSDEQSSDYGDGPSVEEEVGTNADEEAGTRAIPTYLPEISGRAGLPIRRACQFRLNTPPSSSPPPEELEEKIPSFYEKLWAAMERNSAT
ncbi:hypothetical protein FB451DRAFT_1186619 [Mycena latifolia]|nr:hypothetical protein FB451DRAFT_1191413 [Mycena latifolia]KAJ7450905.1 hypothetical protein FB451DRAFT_1186619 [Mycena latifolia]